MSLWCSGIENLETRGCVVKEWEHNGYDDSDFYALIYNKNTNTFDSIM